MTTRVVHVNDEVPGAVYIGRAKMGGRYRQPTSPFGNPFRLPEHPTDRDRAAVLTDYRLHLLAHPALMRRLPELRGKALACWCRHDGEKETPQTRCHGDILIAFLNDYTDDELRRWGTEG